MEDRSQQRPERVFEVVWHQCGPNDPMIDATDLRSGLSQRVYSIEELILFIESCLRSASARPERPERGWRNLDGPEG